MLPNGLKKCSNLKISAMLMAKVAKNCHRLVKIKFWTPNPLFCIKDKKNLQGVFFYWTPPKKLEY